MSVVASRSSVQAMNFYQGCSRGQSWFIRHLDEHACNRVCIILKPSLCGSSPWLCPGALVFVACVQVCADWTIKSCEDVLTSDHIPSICQNRSLYASLASPESYKTEMKWASEARSRYVLDNIQDIRPHIFNTLDQCGPCACIALCRCSYHCRQSLDRAAGSRHYRCFGWAGPTD